MNSILKKGEKNKNFDERKGENHPWTSASLQLQQASHQSTISTTLLDVESAFTKHKNRHKKGSGKIEQYNFT